MLIKVATHGIVNLSTTQIQYFYTSVLECLYNHFLQLLWLYKRNEDWWNFHLHAYASHASSKGERVIVQTRHAWAVWWQRKIMHLCIKICICVIHELAVTCVATLQPSFTCWFTLKNARTLSSTSLHRYWFYANSLWYKNTNILYTRYIFSTLRTPVLKTLYYSYKNIIM